MTTCSVYNRQVVSNRSVIPSGGHEIPSPLATTSEVPFLSPGRPVERRLSGVGIVGRRFSQKQQQQQDDSPNQSPSNNLIPHAPASRSDHLNSPSAPQRRPSSSDLNASPPSSVSRRRSFQGGEQQMSPIQQRRLSGAPEGGVSPPNRLGQRRPSGSSDQVVSPSSVISSNNRLGSRRPSGSEPQAVSSPSSGPANNRLGSRRPSQGSDPVVVSPSQQQRRQSGADQNAPSGGQQPARRESGADLLNSPSQQQRRTSGADLLMNSPSQQQRRTSGADQLQAPSSPQPPRRQSSDHSLDSYDNNNNNKNRRASSDRLVSPTTSQQQQQAQRASFSGESGMAPLISRRTSDQGHLLSPPNARRASGSDPLSPSAPQQRRASNVSHPSDLPVSPNHGDPSAAPGLARAGSRRTTPNSASRTLSAVRSPTGSANTGGTGSRGESAPRTPPSNTRSLLEASQDAPGYVVVLVLLFPRSHTLRTHIHTFIHTVAALTRMHIHATHTPLIPALTCLAWLL